MNKDRREEIRRDTDRVLRQVVCVLQLLDKISRGEDVDYNEAYNELVEMKDQLGQRQEDRELGTLLCSTFESIATNLDKVLRKDNTLRKVRITKASGKRDSDYPPWSSVEGWEAEPPHVGQNYRIYKEDGGVFSTSPVMEIKPDYFITQNSLYRIELLQ